MLIRLSVLRRRGSDPNCDVCCEALLWLLSSESFSPRPKLRITAIEKTNVMTSNTIAITEKVDSDFQMVEKGAECRNLMTLKSLIEMSALQLCALEC